MEFHADSRTGLQGAGFLSELITFPTVALLINPQAADYLARQ